MTSAIAHSIVLSSSHSGSCVAHITQHDVGVDPCAAQADGPLDHAPSLVDKHDVPPHPFLKRPLLHISGVNTAMTDKQLAQSYFVDFLPVRMHMDRSIHGASEASGTVEFQTIEAAEKALATIREPLLSINANPAIDPKAAAMTRLIKQLPHGTQDGDIYNLFRPFGPLQQVARVLTNPAGVKTSFRGMATVTYFNEKHAQHAQTAMHCFELEGKSISVTVYQAPKPTTTSPPTSTLSPSSSTLSAHAAEHASQKPAFNPAASEFVPSSITTVPSGLAIASSVLKATTPAFEPPVRRASQDKRAALILPQASQPGPTIDPCNLYIKNIDSSVDSDGLFKLFKEFGSIVSARVMHDERGKSREFGFVSFKRPEDAKSAIFGRDGFEVCGKHLAVRLHEPKALRQDKLAAKFGPAFDVAKMAATDSPAASESANTSADIDTSLRRASSSKATSIINGQDEADADKEARDPDYIDIAQLRSMNTTLRNDVLRGGFSRRVKELANVSPGEVDAIVSILSQLQLPEAIIALNNKEDLSSRVEKLQAQVAAAVSTSALNANAAESEVASVGGTSMSSVLPSGASERERLAHAVTKALPEEQKVEDITSLLMGLSKKERAMALFNQDYLREKIAEAKQIVEMPDDDEDKENSNKGLSQPLTKANLDKAAQEQVQNVNIVQSMAQQTYTLTQLARLPAAEIVRLANSSEGANLPFPKANPDNIKETDLFIDGLRDLNLNDQKQKLGDQLFKKVRSFGIKGAPKITIALLDSEDLRALAHLMNSYESCLREKVALRAGAALK